MAFEYLAAYATFETVDDMDNEINNRIKEDRFNLTKSERAIVYAIKSHCLDYPGACHLKNETIAKEVGVSLITVSRAIKKLVDLKIIGKANRSKLNGIKGANIYFFLPQDDVSDMMQREEAVEVSNDAVCPPQSEEVSIKSFNHLSFKTSTLQEIYNNAHTEKEAHKEYMNEYQVMLFDFMDSLPLADNLKDELHKVVLAAQVQNAHEFIKAKNVLFKIAMDIKEGILTVTSTLRAVFVGAFNKAVERSNNKQYKSSSIEETADRERPVPFYNWLNERDSRSEICSRPGNLENWLEW